MQRGSLNLSAYRNLSAGFSWVYITNLTNYKPIDRASALRDKIKYKIEDPINDLLDSYAKKIESLYQNTKFSPEEIAIEKNKLINHFTEEYTEKEIEVAGGILGQ